MTPEELREYDLMVYGCHITIKDGSGIETRMDPSKYDGSLVNPYIQDEIGLIKKSKNIMTPEEKTTFLEVFCRIAKVSLNKNQIEKIWRAYDLMLKKGGDMNLRDSVRIIDEVDAPKKQDFKAESHLPVMPNESPIVHD